MRSLGAWYYKCADYVESIECYKKALAINSLFESSWFTMGCAAMKLERWEDAQIAFLKCTSMDPENGEAWNNIAAIFVNTNRKYVRACFYLCRRDALNCLREALKSKHENWRMWENAMLLALDVGEWSEAIHAFRQCFDLHYAAQTGSIEPQCLFRIVQGVTDDESGTVSPALRQRLEDLLNLIVSSAATNPAIWNIFAYFYSQSGNIPKSFECFQAAYRFLNNNEVKFNVDAFENASKCLLNMASIAAAEDIYQVTKQLRAFVSITQVSHVMHELFGLILDSSLHSHLHSFI